MDTYNIKGGKRLSGVIEVAGAKNAALPIMAAAVMTCNENILEACPDISDVKNMLEILSYLGCDTRQEGDVVSINSNNADGFSIPEDMMKKMRSSIFLAGALLARCGKAVIGNPGGCNIGKRPIDIHINGLKKLGVKVDNFPDKIILTADSLKAADIALPYPSVGATENIMMAATAAKGTTRIINPAREPEIEDLQNYLNKCGGKVSGAGSTMITIAGEKKLIGCSYRIMPDRIEAGTYMLMVIATGGELIVKNVRSYNMSGLIKTLQAAGCDISCENDFIKVRASGLEKIKAHIVTEPYPGFPTDLQPQMVSLLAAKGKGSTVEEKIFENRFEYVKQLKKMGADIELFQKKVIINSNKILCGANVNAEDLRGGAALVIAALTAEGITRVSNTKYIKRGYSSFREKIAKIGGEITENEIR